VQPVASSAAWLILVSLGRQELMNVDAITVALEDALGRLDESPSSHGANPDLPIPLREAIQEDDCAKGVSEVLKAQAEFAAPLMINWMNGMSGFHADMVGPLLLGEARRRGSAKSAVQWLQKVLGTEKGTGIAVQTLWGLSPAQHIQLLDDVELMPFNSLPASRQKELLSKSEWPGGLRLLTPMYAWHPPSAALVVRRDVVPYLVDAKGAEDFKTNESADLYSRFTDIRLCLALSGPTTIVPGPAWFHYLDPDLEVAVIGVGTLSSHQEILPMHFPPNTDFDPSEAGKLVSAFMKLEPWLETRIRTAMERLHQSLIRRSPADKSLELAIALETLLVNSAGEHTFKIALRAALMTADSVDERSRNRAIIEAAYGMRSALMHSGQSPKDCKVRGHGTETAVEVVAEAARITARVIRRVLAEGRLPDWSRFELSNVF
jgi:hypothetical protein